MAAGFLPQGDRLQKPEERGGERGGFWGVDRENCMGTFAADGVRRSTGEPPPSRTAATSLLQGYL
jgi:hypothetical protein